ncbi:organic cation transporter protein-like [Ylistrum balloti]|uniref:organic cation transporter protein-like n=1 Tax=Ylistrum balloti TaxID=509963 RepID=UPI002905B5C9|nr:organic cation transporter protein-like [Ylistrum balloti]
MIKAFLKRPSSTCFKFDLKALIILTWGERQKPVMSWLLKSGKWAIDRDIWLSAAHIPGRENVEADTESRLEHENTEWRLHTSIFQILNPQSSTTRNQGQEQPSKDDINGLSGVRRSLRMLSIPPDVEQINLSSWRPSTVKQYSTFFKKWTTFASSEHICAVSPDIRDILSFLISLYHKGLGYSAINSARSMLSTFVVINGQGCGTHPLIKRFMKGVFNLRPALPRNNVSWDPEQVLTFLKTMDCGTLKSLTLKLVTMLALLTGQRLQSLHLLDIKNISLTDSSLKLRFGDALKQTRPGFHQREITLQQFEDKQLCVVSIFLSKMKKFEEVLSIIGEFGPYQKRIFFLICIPFIFSAFHMVISVFLLGIPDHRCAIPGYPNDTYAIQSPSHQALINRHVPPSTDETLDYVKCDLYDRSYDGDDNSTNMRTCSAWVYDESIYINTFTSQQNIVCEDKLRTSHAQMIFFGGVFLGAIILGSVSDIIGRKKTLCLSFLMLFGTTLGLAWAPDYITFCILRFLVGASCAGMFMTAFVIGMELVGPSKRVYAGIIVDFFFAIGMVVLGGIGYAFREWKYIEITCSAPIALFLFYWWLVPESPRWLISQGRIDEANKIIQKAAKVNKVTIPEKILTADSIDEPEAGRLWHLFTSRVLLIRTMIIFFNWLVVVMGYYGLSLNTGNLGGDFYANFMISGLVEFPAYFLCLVLLDRVGRRLLHASCMILGGIACIITLFPMLYADESLQPITITLAMLGKVGISAAFAIIYVWSAELFPTVVRNAGMGASSSCARIGGMIAPYIADLSKVIDGNLGRAIPLVIFGGASVVAGILSLWLPETKDRELPETMEDGKLFGKKKSSEKYKPTLGFDNKTFESEAGIANGKNGVYTITKL